jgi:hypothetical protein
MDGETAVIGRMPILGGHDERKLCLELVGQRDNLVPLGHGQSSSGQEVILNIDQDQCVHLACRATEFSLVMVPAKQYCLAVLFATTLFLSASLLFWVQPLVAKLVLPLLGGTPAVWNGCMVFFQMMLLAGYSYAHWIGRSFSLRTQVKVQLAVLALASVALPVRLATGSLRFLPADSSPALWLLGCLFWSVGLPVFAVATNGPLLQRWFSRSSLAQDPYFLYAASNLGSLAALLSYPLLVEPWLTLGQQSRAWSAGFLILIALILGCGLLLLNKMRGVAQDERRTSEESTAPAPPVQGRERLRWTLLAFVPSSLLLGLTSYLTTDIASLPLLWVLPLAIYLLTFVLAFARPEKRQARWPGRFLPMAMIGMAYMLLSEATEPAWMLISLHLLVFFVAAMVCHGRLAAGRPPPAHLTEFYLWISVGGVLGGLFNALAAPMLFSRIVEYPAAMVLACLLRPPERMTSSAACSLRKDLGLAIGISLAAAAVGSISSYWTELPVQAHLALAFGVPLLMCYAAVDRPIAFGLAIGGVMLASVLAPGTHGRPLFLERNFYGVLRVTRDPLGPFYRLVHGNTIHGRQWIDPARRGEPLSYYHRTGPLGQVFAMFHSRLACTYVAVVGVGAGSMAAYARAGEDWTFYEINPAVVSVAKDPRYFSYLTQCAASRTRIILGDARLRLRDAAATQFDLLVLDAFSSDAIPLHLITREALRLYLSKLAPGGLLVFHISNRCLDLESVLGNLAKEAGLVCHAHDEADPSPQEIAEGKNQSHWLVMAWRREDLGRLARDSRWQPIKGDPHAAVWTDNFSNVASVFRWE